MSNTKSCAQCGKSVIATENGFVHEGGGMYEQKCQNCGWKGGQAGGYSQCPRCSDKTSLINDHKAS